jgi:UDP-N-acetylglucosamine 2-epimerase (non-hydrolysing)
VLSEFCPDYVLIQGDTTTAMASAVTAFYHRIRIGHVEAGLRTKDLYSPWPEEANRRVVGMLTHFHFAPTTAAKDNLIREGVPAARVFLTGNTVVDALISVVKRIDASAELQAQCERALPAAIDFKKRLIVVTGHRRESFGEGLERVFSALAKIGERDDVQILYPVHLNPRVANPAHSMLDGARNVFLSQPLDYLTFVYAMMRAHFLITDSGGIQEEALILGKPLLITRENTERPEAVRAGTGVLVGTDFQKIVAEATRLLDDRNVHVAMSRKLMAFGDGQAASHIVKVLHDD